MSSSGGFQYRAGRHSRRNDFTRRNAARSRRDLTALRIAGIRAGVDELSLDLIADHENLLRTFYRIRSERDPAPGPDGIRLRYLGNSEAAEITRGLSLQLRAEHFRPQPPRLIQIRKRPGPGTRPIRLPDALSHIVATAINDRLAAGISRFLLATCYGFCKGRNAWQMLASIVVGLEATGSAILLNDDIRRAFENVRVEQVMDLLRELGLDARLIDLIRTLVTVGNDDRTIGIHQGSELSPTLLNVLLHFTLDAPLQERFPDVHLHRYADNMAMVVPGGSAADASRYHDEISQFLAAAGMELKREDGGIFDLSIQTTPLLGFCLSKPQGRVLIQLPDTVETLVTDNLDDLVRIEGRDHQRARDCLLGWFGSLGPAYRDMDVEEVCATALRTAGDQGFRDIVSVQELRRKWANAYQRWDGILTTARARSAGQSRGVGGLEIGLLSSRHHPAALP